MEKRVMNKLLKAKRGGTRLHKPASEPVEQVLWTEAMSDRRAGGDRRTINGRQITVADLRAVDERRDNDRRKIRLTITGRALDVGH